MNLRLVALLSFAVSPLVICLILYGSHFCLAPWREAPVALGWTAARPIWLLHPRWGEQYDSTRAFATQRRALRENDVPAALKQLHPHGLSLVLRDGLAPHDDHPLSLVLCSELSADRIGLVARYQMEAVFSNRLERALVEAPDDPLVRADWLATNWSRGDRSLNRLRPAEHGVASGSSQVPSNEPTSPASEACWSLLVDAGLILVSSLPAGVHGHYVALIEVGGVPDMRIWRRVQLESLDGASRESYVAAMGEFARSGPGDLELPLQRRAAQTWRELGLDANGAIFAGTSDQGTSSQIVGWHCALHLEALEDFASSAGDVEAAADWLELAAAVANHLSESVRSPGIYNYIQQKRAELTAIAQSIAKAPDRPPAVAERIDNVLGRLRPGTPRTLAAPSAYVAPAIYLDNLSRAFLSVCVVTWTTAGVGWLGLRYWSKEQRGGPDLDSARAMVPIVAILAIVVTAVAFGLLEVCNYLGEGAASAVYGIVGIAFTLTMLMSVWWLVAGELAYDADATRVPLRRRMIGLVGCGVIGVASRLLLNMGASAGRTSSTFRQFQLWAFDPTHERLPIFLRGVFALAFPGLLVVYAALRRARNPHSFRLFHISVITVAGLVLGAWFLVGPFGEWVHRDRPAAPPNLTEWSPTVVAADTIGNVLNQYFYWSRGKPGTPPSPFGWGWNLLTATGAQRVTNFGFWLALAAGTIWAFEAWRRSRASRRQDLKEVRPDGPRHSIGVVWLDGMTRTCFWLGLIALTLHAWCTLGLGYCASHVIAQRL